MTKMHMRTRAPESDNSNVRSWYTSAPQHPDLPCALQAGEPWPKVGMAWNGQCARKNRLPFCGPCWSNTFKKTYCIHTADACSIVLHMYCLYVHLPRKSAMAPRAAALCCADRCLDSALSRQPRPQVGTAHLFGAGKFSYRSNLKKTT